jgi:hypothetical protein
LARSRTVPRAEASEAVGKNDTDGKPSHSRPPRLQAGEPSSGRHFGSEGDTFAKAERPGVAKTASGFEGARVETMDGRLLGRTDGVPGESVEAVDERLRAAVGRRGGLPR